LTFFGNLLEIWPIIECFGIAIATVIHFTIGWIKTRTFAITFRGKVQICRIGGKNPHGMVEFFKVGGGHFGELALGNSLWGTRFGDLTSGNSLG
jgi:hypothetical protein